MVHVLVRPAFFTLSLTGLLLSLPSVVLADVDIQVMPAQVPGITCIFITYDCDDPESVQLSIDSNAVIDHVSGEDILSAPRAPCFDESDFGAGTHTFSVEATCDSDVTDDAATASFVNPPVGLLGVEHTKFEWSAGDTVVFTLHTQSEDLEVEVDFSAVDSDYIPNSEVVTDIGDGDYEVSYTLSSANTTPAAEYRLPVSISPGGTLIRTHWDAVTIRYPRSAPGPSPVRTRRAAPSISLICRPVRTRPSSRSPTHSRSTLLPGPRRW